jgi:Methyltransferase domain
VRVSTSPGDEKLVSKTKKQSGQTEISWIAGSTIYEFRLYAGSDPDTLIDSVRVWRDLNAASTSLRDLANEALRGNVDMAEISRFIAAVIPAYLQTDRFRDLFPVLLHQLASDAMRGSLGASELSNFFATVIPKYLDNSISGKILAAPNPVPFAAERVLITWGTNDPGGGEVRLFTSSGQEELIARQPSGQMEIPWISGSMEYEFRLYASSRPDMPIDSVKVKRDLGSTPVVMREIADEVRRGNIDMMELSQFIATVMPRCLHGGKFQEIFPVWERHGFHVTPVHFYQPIPDTQNLSDTLWNRPSELVGIDMNDSVQLDLLRTCFPKFRSEYEQIPIQPTGEQDSFHLNNRLFGGTDALVAYCMVRQFRPELIIEVGGGFSSLLLGQAAAKNNNSALICIEPFPQEFLKHGFRGLHSLIEKKVEDVDLDFFSQLGPGDVLFIDSSHTVKIGGDVNYLFLEVLPRLKPGVVVHVHDIFLPFEYRRDWVKEEFLFWTEQYLLQAFLTFNSEFEVLMANGYLGHRYMEDLKATFANSPWWGGGSFWMRRKPRR